MNALIIVSLVTLVIAFAIPLVTWFIGRQLDDTAMTDEDRKRANALPFIGNGTIPPERNLSLKDDSQKFVGIVLLLFRSWPYIRPQLMGRWYYPERGLSEEVADNVSGSGYSFAYAPILVGIVAIAGPMTGMVEASFDYPMHFLYIAVGIMFFNMGALSIPTVTGRLQAGFAITLALAAFAANLIAALVIDGMLDTLYVVLLTAVCFFGWMAQTRVEHGSNSKIRLVWRFRMSAHLAYYYILIGIQGFIGLAMGLVLTDLLMQSLIQSDPVHSGVAQFFGHPEFARGGEITELTVEQRHQIKWWYVQLSLGLWVLNLPIGIIRPWYHVWIMQRINQDLRLALVQRWHQLSLSYHSDHRTGDSIYRIYQDSAQVTAVIGQIVEILTNCWGYLLALILVSFLSPTIGLIAATIVIPAIFWARWGMPRMRVRSLVYRAATSDITSRIQESFAAIRLIKAYRAEDRVQKDMEEDSVVAFNAAFQVRLMIALVTIVMFTIAAHFLLTGEFLMAMYANRGDPTFANELIAVMGFSFVVWNLTAHDWGKGKFHETSNMTRSVMRQWLSAQDMAMGLRRVFDILDIDPEIVDAPAAVPLEEFKQEIRFDDVAFHYQADRPVLDGVSFQASPGSITAIVGPTGSGKSTLMGLLLRLYDPTAGKISIDGLDLKEYQIESIRSNAAIALQENVLFALSVRDNIRYVAPEATDEEIHEAIRVACMDDYVDELPNGLDTVLGDRGGKLSTGQRQRLSIARAVVRDTAILILDEPTAALDAATEHEVMTNLAEWGQGRAIFLITHRISTIRRANNILYLDEGRIIESGDHNTLMRLADGRYRHFVETESNLAGVESI